MIPELFMTGLGCVCAAGPTVDATVSALATGGRAPRPPQRIAIDWDKVGPVFEVPSDLSDEAAAAAAWYRRGGIDPCAAGRTTRLAWVAAVEALRQAGLDAAGLRGLRVGVAVGTTVGCTLNNEPFYRAWRAGEHPPLEGVDRFLGDNPALHLARLLGVRGPAATLANACSSGTDAVGLAASWLRAGLCDIALAGGADELSRVTCLGFASLMITAAEPCRPFDLHRTGLNLGEGAGIVVLETERTRRARGAPALARVAGYATNADAHHPTAPHPEGEGLRRSIAQVLVQAGAGADAVAFCNAHGTSTPENDRVEGQVLAALFPPDFPVVSTKSYTGHTLGAAGGIEAVLTVRALLDGWLPATAGFGEADPACGIVPTRGLTRVSGRLGLSNSLAFGGNNSVLLLERGECA